MQRNRKPTEQQKDEAAVWLAKRQGGSLSAQEKIVLEHWLNREPGNRLAFDQMRILWAQLEEPAERLENKARLRLPWGRLRLPRLRGAIVSAGIACAFWAGLWLTAPNILQNWQADILSGDGIVTVATLPDGSKVHMSADTALDTDFGHGRRHVTLLRGEAFFEVEHNKAAPFTVRDDEAHIRVVGTRFNVEQHPGHTAVSVEQGAVEVKGRHDAKPAMLHPGQSVRVSHGQAGMVAEADLAHVLSWMKGQISVRGVTVASLADTLERYSTGRILVLPTLSDRTISGTFPATDINASLDTIAAATGGEVLHTSPWLTLLY